MNPLKVLNSLLVSLPVFLLSAQAEVLDATWNAATDIPVTAASYSATGNTVNLTLNHTPAPGEKLTVVKNTGLAFIQGVFDNLSQGQEVALTYSGTTYQFLANYYGGTGNDLVLQWAEQRLAAWGHNLSNQFGDNTYTNSSVPIAVVARGAISGKVLAIAAGYQHGLALCSNGTVAAWGNNIYGQLGNNYFGNGTVPVAVDASGILNGKTVIAVAAGSFHSLALCSDGTVAAWGANDQGQLGNNSTTFSNVPVAVNNSGVLSGKTVVAISTKYRHSLALCSDGTLAAWGYNYNGQLGNNSTTNSNVPVAVNTTGVLSGKTVVTVAAGESHSLAVCSDGTVAAWGGRKWSAWQQQLDR